MPVKKEQTSKSSSTAGSGAADEAFRASSEFPADGRRVELSTDISKKSEYESDSRADISQGKSREVGIPSNGNVTTEHDSTAVSDAMPIEGRMGGSNNGTPAASSRVPTDARRRYRTVDVEDPHPPAYPQRSLISAEVAPDFDAAVNQAVEAALRRRDESIVEAQVIVSGSEPEEAPANRNGRDRILKSSDGAQAKKKRRILLFGVTGLFLVILAIVLGITLGVFRGEDVVAKSTFNPARPTDTPTVDPDVHPDDEAPRKEAAREESSDSAKRKIIFGGTGLFLLILAIAVGTTPGRCQRRGCCRNPTHKTTRCTNTPIGDHEMAST
eukprot:scaffold5554_cov159-Cylindrotheca_fusiformis.AAC.4